MTEPAVDNSSCSDRIWYAGMFCILLVYTALRIPLLGIPCVRDEGYYGVAAQALLSGATMYRDVFDHKPPGIFYIYKLALSIFPSTPTGLHSFLHAWNLVTLGVIMSLARALGGRLAALWSGWIFALNSCDASIEGHVACTEIFMLLPISVSLRLALAAWSMGNDSRQSQQSAAKYLWVASGVFGAAACWIKQPAALLLLVIPLFLLANLGLRGISRALRVYAFWLAGGIVLSLLICFAFRDVFGEFMRWSFVQSSEQFLTMWNMNWRENLETQLIMWGKDLAFPLTVCITSFVVGIRKNIQLVKLGLFLFAASLAAAVQNGYLCLHYFALTALPVTLVAGMSMASITPYLKARGRVWLTGALILSALPLAWSEPNYHFYPLWDAEFYAAAYLRERSTPDDSIFIFGQEPQIMFLAQRRSANPYIDMYPLLRNIPRHQEFQHHAWERIEAEKPLYMIMTYVSSPWKGEAGVDQFFRNQCRQLQQDHYRLESLLIYDFEAAKFRFVPSVDEAPRSSKTLVRLLEFWRRSDSAP